MTYEVRLENHSDHLSVVVSGALARGMAAQLAEQVIEAYRRDPLPSLLVDLRGLSIHVEPDEALQLVESYPSIATGLRVKTGIVFGEHNAEAVRFYEMVTQNRGYPTAAFVEIEPALNWLRG